MFGGFSCSFTRRDCPHTTLFLPTYQRVNRTRQNKILRCFPHCCRGHAARSYCGASLHVQVDFDSGATATTGHRVLQPNTADDVLLFARFRPLQQRHLGAGEQLASASVLTALQSESNPSGEWIQGRVLASADRTAWLFELNRSARWHYCWGSSAATTSRRTEHVLEVVVCVGRRGHAPLEIVATTCSPPFRVVSFRRNATGGSRDVADDASASHSHVASPLPPVVVPSSASSSSPLAVSSLSPASSAPPRRPRSPRSTLTLLLSAATAISAADISTYLPSVVSTFEATVLAGLPRSTTPSPRPVGLLDTVADIALWLALSAEVRVEWHRALVHAAAHVANRPRLLNAYTEWSTRLCSKLDERLAMHPQWPSVDALVDAALPPNIRIDSVDPSGGPTPGCFESFVANVRQVSVAQAKNRTRRRGQTARNKTLSTLPLHTATPMTWWYCPLASVRVWPLVPMSHDVIRGVWPPSVSAVAWFYRQLACIAIVPSESVAASQVPRTTIVSAAGVSQTPLLGTTGMPLVLDGQPRWTATLPNGDATLGATLEHEWHVGDYIARERPDGSLSVQWFAWRNAPHAAARCCDLELAWLSATDLLVVATVESGILAPSSGPFDETLSCAQRLARVDAWTPLWRAELRYHQR